MMSLWSSDVHILGVNSSNKTAMKLLAPEKWGDYCQGSMTRSCHFIFITYRGWGSESLYILTIGTQDKGQQTISSIKDWGEIFITNTNQDIFQLRVNFLQGGQCFAFYCLVWFIYDCTFRTGVRHSKKKQLLMIGIKRQKFTPEET